MQSGPFRWKKNRCILICQKLLRSCCFWRVLAALWAAVLSKAVVINQILRLEFPCIGCQQTRDAKWKAFVCLHRKNFNPKGWFMICSEHFNEDCFKRLFHTKGNVRRLEPGSNRKFERTQKSCGNTHLQITIINS